MSWRVVLLTLLITVSLCPLTSALKAEDQPQWGERYTRNMVSSETDLPVHFDPSTGQGIKWSAPLGTRAYSTPVVSSGRVILGANNDDPRDPRHQGDRGVLLCLNEQDGSLLWQLVVPKLQGDPYLDQPHYGICSPATVEGDRVYIVTNRAEVLCLDLHGQDNGNDGPYLDEGRHMSPEGQPAMEVTSIDADIIWLFDMWAETGMHPHDSAHSSILLDGDYLYLNTGNGTDNTHRKIRGPDAPSLIVLDKHTGRLVAQDKEHIGPRIFHCSWSSPAMGVVNGQKLVFFCGGDGICYAFKALDNKSLGEEVQMLERVWKFDCDPTAPKEDVHRFVGNRKESPSNIKSMPVFHNNRLYVTGGGDIWWGKDKSWLKCIDATQQGDITKTGELWSSPLEQHACTTPAVSNGLVFVGDCLQRERDGNVYCIDADTGERLWSDPTKGSIWASAMVADGKVYIGTRRGELRIYAAAKQRKLINEIQFENPIGATITPANGVLYLNTLSRLFAIEKPAS
jgi:outer membrane protein assembly factor BamB